ncbi:MAG: carbamoyltransferase HypF, partial [Candidatus Electrothrix sp. AR4]|nr:carbamoyltransferase HypF [Candidatus Electrothrix sp. AR4]
MAERVRLTISGQVQGVGFRPTLYRYANDAELSGFVSNTSTGVIIEVQGEVGRIDTFLCRVTDNPPPLARIDTVTRVVIPEEPANEFQIMPSSVSSTDNAPADPMNSIFILPPDLGICEQCRQ